MRALFLTNSINGLYFFRRELVEHLLRSGAEVAVSAPKDTHSGSFAALGCRMFTVSISRRGANPLKDLRLLLSYLAILREVKPDVVLTYTIKPNVYGGIACRLTGTPCVANVTGLGTSLENPGFLQRLSLKLYRIGLKKASCVFFQNRANRDFFMAKGSCGGRSRLIPGSGVNLSRHSFEAYPPPGEGLRFLFVGRIMREKGIEELLQAASRVRALRPEAIFDVVGACDGDYQARLKNAEKDGLIHYLGRQQDVRPFLRRSHALILPSYHEGMSNVLLEAAATGRPVIASDVPGCRETFEDGVTGIACAPRDSGDLAEKILGFIGLPHANKARMGERGRRKMEEEFDRGIVIEAYLEEIGRAAGSGAPAPEREK